MGAIHNAEEDEIAVEQLRAMPEEARLWLNHHIGNSMQVLLNAEYYHNPEHVARAARHIIEDMQRIGCFQFVTKKKEVKKSDLKLTLEIE